MFSDLTTWWQALGSVEQWFWATGLISNALFAGYIVAQFAGGHDADVHTDTIDSDAGFTILSLRSLMAFGMFMGYTGVVALRLGAGLFVALLAGAVAGVLAAWLAWRLLRLVLRLQSSGTLDIQNTIGQTGEVHLQIPARMSDTGKVMVEVQGALREMDAISEEEAIPTGQPILVVGVTDDGALIVQPFKPPVPVKLPAMLLAM